METSGTKCLQDIKNLYASGGGDCPELTFTGILEAMKAENQNLVHPCMFSPMRLLRTPQKTT